MPKKFDVMAAAGQYTDSQGQQKTRWIRCGAVIENQNGNLSLILESIPLGLPPNENGHGVWLSLFEPKPPQQGQQMPPQQQNYGQQAPPQQAPQQPQGNVPPATGNEW